jgi:hypothetical protein
MNGRSETLTLTATAVESERHVRTCGAQPARQHIATTGSNNHIFMYPHLTNGFRLRCTRFDRLVEHATRPSFPPRKCSALPNMQGVLRHANDHIVFAYILL